MFDLNGTVARLTKPHLPVMHRHLFDVVAIDPVLEQEKGETASRGAIAQALNILLLADLIDRTPTAAAYVNDVDLSDGMLILDHGAARTIDMDGMGGLPRGREALARILEPMGYTESKAYPLDQLGMTGFSYTYSDLPESLPQFFISELHVDQFSTKFQYVIKDTFETSEDPLDNASLQRLHRLSLAGNLPVADAVALLPALVASFDRQHAIPLLTDYETLLAESSEAAWIATEGNSLNHATHRVADVKKLAAEQTLRGRPMKTKVEISQSGRVLQTAYKADPVERSFIDENGNIITRAVPGSFFEFIQRAQLTDPTTGMPVLDLSFDSNNAQGIFKMTAA
jgi:hypothetical protein